MSESWGDLVVRRFVNHVILSPLLERDIFKGLDCVLTARMHKKADAALSSLDHPVRSVDLVLHRPRRFRAYALHPETSNDVVISLAC